MLRLFICVTLISLISCCQPPDCDREDCGACANACCNLNYYFAIGVQDITNRIIGALKSGGPDKGYTFVDSQDLRPYNITAQFILQGIHTTLVMRYNDTLNFAVYNESGNFFQSRVNAFSISQIATAYCDAGQNYKNLVGLIKSLGINYLESTIAGCPKKP